MKIIYVRGGDKTAPAVAQACGMEYGIRHDYKAYGPVYMLDIDFHKYEHFTTDDKRRAFWRGYMIAVDKHKPEVAMAADYFDFQSSTALLNEQLSDLQARGVNRIMVCPKFAAAVASIPDWCIVAVSVPAKTYAGFLPDYRELEGRMCHLLGGKPEKQVDVMRKILGAGGSVVSVDGSYHARKAGLGQWFDGGGWVQLRNRKVLTFDLAVASGKNIVKYLNRASLEAQPMLHNEGNERK